MAPRRASMLLTLAAASAAALLGLPAAQAGSSAGPGRLLGATGVAFGGIIEFNSDASHLVNLTPNTFDMGPADGPSKSDYPSLSGNGQTVAFASNRGGRGWRIYAMHADGSALRQVTFAPEMGGRYPNDTDPVVSPDGKTIAFLSNRAGLALNPQQGNLTNVYLINLDGSGLHRLTASQDDNGTWSNVVGLAWSPDSHELAFRGQRLTPDQNGHLGIRDTLGFIGASGGREQDVVVNDCADAGLLDWVGSSILYSYGGAVQGCPATEYLIRDAATGATTSISAATLGAAPNGVGSARLSPDGSRIVTSEPNGNACDVVTMSRTGADVHRTRTPIACGEWLWWAAGAAVPAPAKLMLDPAQVVLTPGGAPVQTQVLLLDARGQVISRSAASWSTSGNSISLTSTGLVSAAKTASTQTAKLQATNGGVTAAVTLTVGH